VVTPAAKSLLEDAGTPAIALMRATTVVLGEFLAWEPESVWLELHRQSIDLPEENRAKLMAAHTLRLMPSFYWDAIVFEKTALAFDGVMPAPEILEEASPARLAWAVVEAAWIIRETREASWEFQHEPRAYAAVVLNRAGYVFAPEQLSFAQAWLNRERRHDHLLEDVKERWSHVSKDHLEQLTLGENPEDVQIARLAAVELHVRSRRAAAERALTRLA
jgi:hypothetical protein